MILTPSWCLRIDASFFRDLLCCATDAARCRLGGLRRLRGAGQDWRFVELYSWTRDTRRTGSWYAHYDEFLHLFIRQLCFRDDVVDERSYPSLRAPKLSSIKKRVLGKGVDGRIHSLAAWIHLNQGMTEGDQIRSRRRPQGAEVVCALVARRLVQSHYMYIRRY